jgi:hypothetical protein
VAAVSGAWIGVDFDGTLAYHREGAHVVSCGEPILAMVARVRAWIAEGLTVRIVTARVGMTVPQIERDRQIEIIHRWCRMHLGTELAVVASKDYGMIALWDDRAVQVVRNTGQTVDDATAAQIVHWAYNRDYDPTDSNAYDDLLSAIQRGDWKNA